MRGDFQERVKCDLSCVHKGGFVKKVPVPVKCKNKAKRPHSTGARTADSAEQRVWPWLLGFMKLKADPAVRAYPGRACAYSRGQIAEASSAHRLQERPGSGDLSNANQRHPRAGPGAEAEEGSWISASRPPCLRSGPQATRFVVSTRLSHRGRETRPSHRGRETRRTHPSPAGQVLPAPPSSLRRGRPTGNDDRGAAVDPAENPEGRGW